MAYPTVTVELALGVDPTSDYLVFDDDDRGRFNVGVFAPEVEFWTDFSAYRRSHTITRGRQELLEHYDRGVATVVFDDPDGDLIPNNSSSPFYPNLLPEIRMRIRYTFNGVVYDRFHGFVDFYRVNYGHPKGATVTIQATDGQKVLARFNPPAASMSVGDGDTVAERLNRICDLASWPEGDRDFDTGLTTLQPTTLAQNALTEAQLSVDSEGGELYVAANGKLTYRDRHARHEDAISQDVQATFGDDTGEIHYESLDLADFSAAMVKNSISVAAIGGEAATTEDETSKERYFEKPWHRHDLIHDTGLEESQGHANQVLFYSKDPRERVKAVHVLALNKLSTAVWEDLLPLDSGHRVRVRRRPDAGDALDEQCFIEGVNESVKPGPVFDFTFHTSSASPVDDGIFIFDDDDLGEFDDDTFAAW